MLRRLTLLVLGMALAVPSAAFAQSAKFFPGAPVDSGGIVRLGDVDTAQDGSGATVYVKADAGVDHVFASRLVSGVWQPPERLDADLPGPAAQPVVAAGDGGKLVAAFVSAGQLFTVVRQVGQNAWSKPIPGPAGASNPSIAMSINGVAYVVWSQAGNVQAARLEKKGTAFTAIPQPLDVNPAAEAGGAPNEAPKVAVSADGVALVVWGEAGHVYARHLYEQRVSTAPQELDVAQFASKAGTGGDSPDVAVEADSSYAWAAFRQGLADGTTRVLARRLRGSLFDDPVDVGGAGDASTGAPRVALNGTGAGMAASIGASTGGVYVDAVVNDVFQPPQTAWSSSRTPSQVRVVMAAGGTGVAAWMVDDTVNAAWMRDGKGLARARVDDPALGAVDPDGGLEIAGNKNGDTVMLFVQTAADGTRRLVSAILDHAPRAFTISTTSNYKNSYRPKLAWATAIDSWGPITYTVKLDGVVLGTTTSRSVVPRNRLAAGDHTLSVSATDPRGQTVSARSARVRIDTVAPTGVLHTTGIRKERQRITFRVSATDPKKPLASGVKTVSIDPGDGSGAVEASTLAHVYAPGDYTVTARIADRAGNVTRITRDLVIAKAPKKKHKKHGKSGASGGEQDSAAGA